MPKLTVQQRVEILSLLSLNSSRGVAEIFNNKYPDRLPPLTHSAVLKISKKFSETGKVVDLDRSGRPKSSEDTQLRVLCTAIENPRMSTKRMSTELEISRPTISKILRSSRYKPYKAHLHNKLYTVDTGKRVQFCNNLIEQMNAFPLLLSSILWSDESLLFLNQGFNRQNNR